MQVVYGFYRCSSYLRLFKPKNNRPHHVTSDPSYIFSFVTHVKFGIKSDNRYVVGDIVGGIMPAFTGYEYRIGESIVDRGSIVCIVQERTTQKRVSQIIRRGRMSLTEEKNTSIHVQWNETGNRWGSRQCGSSDSHSREWISIVTEAADRPPLY